MQKYCAWKNWCNNKYLCCHFCNNKTCDLRCKDNLEECKYRADHPKDEERINALIKEVQQEQAATEKLYKISDAAKLLKKSYDYLYDKVKANEIQSVKQNNHIFISQSEVDRLTNLWYNK